MADFHLTFCLNTPLKDVTTNFDNLLTVMSYLSHCFNSLQLNFHSILKRTETKGCLQGYESYKQHHTLGKGQGYAVQYYL